MKHIPVLFLVTALAALVHGGTFTNESPAGMKIIWAVPTNAWPPPYKIWTYKVIPQQFSDAVVSNTMAIGSFTMKDKRKLSAEALALDKKALSFANKDETKWLAIAPSLGYIEFYDEHAEAGIKITVKDSVTNAVNVPAIGVPDQAETTQLGLNYLRLLGIDIDEIARQNDANNLDLHWSKGTRKWTDQNTGKDISDVYDFGVYFTRRIDGINMSGFGDIFVQFGDNAKVSKLEVSWRNLQPYQLHDNFITPEQIVKLIQSGQTPVTSLPGWPMTSIRTLTITNAVPCYVRPHKQGDEPVDFIVPALQLDAIMDNGKTNQYTWFQTSIFPPKN